MLRKVKHIGRKATKYHFNISLNQLEVKGTKLWQPYKLVVVLTRKKKKISGTAQSWRPSIKDPYLGSATWSGQNQKPLELTITLFEDESTAGFECKNWVFVIENESRDGKRKPIASSRVDMAQYACSLPPSSIVDLTFKPLTNKLRSAKLNCSISCDFLSAGPATEADVVSIAGSTASEDTIRLGDIDLEDLRDLDSFNNSRSGSFVAENNENFLANQQEMTALNNQIQSLNQAIDADMEMSNLENVSEKNPFIDQPTESKGSNRSSIRSGVSEHASSVNAGDSKVTDNQIKSNNEVDDDKNDVDSIDLNDSNKRISISSGASSSSSSFQRRRLRPSADFLTTTHNEKDLSPSQSSPAPTMQKSLLRWCQDVTKGYEGVKVTNFTTSWRNGLALCALLHHYHPDHVEFERLSGLDGRSNVKKAIEGFRKLNLTDHPFLQSTTVSDKNALISFLMMLRDHFSADGCKPDSSDVDHQSNIRTSLPHIFHKTLSSPNVLYATAKVKLLADLEEKEMEDDVFSSALERKLERGKSSPNLDIKTNVTMHPNCSTFQSTEVQNMNPEVTNVCEIPNDLSPKVKKSPTTNSKFKISKFEVNAMPSVSNEFEKTTDVTQKVETPKQTAQSDIKNTPLTPTTSITSTPVINSPSRAAVFVLPNAACLNSVPLDIVLNNLQESNLEDSISTNEENLSAPLLQTENSKTESEVELDNTNPFLDESNDEIEGSQAQKSPLSDMYKSSSDENSSGKDNNLEVAIQFSAKLTSSSSEEEAKQNHSSKCFHETFQVENGTPADIYTSEDELPPNSFMDKNQNSTLEVAVKLNKSETPKNEKKSDEELEKAVEKLLKSSAERNRKARAMEIIAKTQAEVNSVKESKESNLSYEEQKRQEKVRERALKLIDETRATLGRNRNLDVSDSGQDVSQLPVSADLEQSQSNFPLSLIEPAFSEEYPISESSYVTTEEKVEAAQESGPVYNKSNISSLSRSSSSSTSVSASTLTKEKLSSSDDHPLKNIPQYGQTINSEDVQNKQLSLKENITPPPSDNRLASETPDPHQVDFSEDSKQNGMSTSSNIAHPLDIPMKLNNDAPVLYSVENTSTVSVTNHQRFSLLASADVEERWSSMVKKSSSSSAIEENQLEIEKRALDAELRLVEERSNEVHLELQEIKGAGGRTNRRREGDLMQEWFQLVNKKNSIIRQQDQVALMEEEQFVVNKVETIHEELIPLMAIEESMKTLAQKEREMELLSEKVRLVNERDKIMQMLNEKEKNALDEEEMLQTTLGANMNNLVGGDEKCLLM